ncbi:phosphonate metabolism transcriptional regulator PhnF [Sulfitobacter sp. EhC04]|uniref:phosphonate metabolism transcriptional regulator PhnF n=1 Tax=Sulfitobacter sp. EhC04 TaxID=1849168 RepID=UPI0007F5171C|nr:phosphonate metabolism transcriptional regulator PhnF [Sulfitobacter sp. EhC04]OAN77082.1 phosphonate metabolism transcriptional regulator PhnF [Sulfitobacter sp. EhC04]
MARTPIWRSIATTLRGEISAGQYAPGDKLPTEAVLAARFGVNRHTVRHALAALAEDGVVFARRGAGVFVTQVPTDYPIGKRVRFHQNLTSAGRVPTKRILSMQTRGATGTERSLLALADGAQVHVVDGLSLADDLPVAVFTSVFPAARFPDLPAYLEEAGSVTEALRRSGVRDYTRASTRLKAKLASATQALHLQIAEGAPVLFSTSVNVDPEGRPVEFGSTWFAGDRITLTLDGE